MAWTVALATSVTAQEQTDHAAQAAQHDDEGHGSPSGHGHHYRNALGPVLGGTYESEEEKTFFTVGVEYERLFNERFAVLPAVEYITDVDALLFVVPFVYRHGSGLRLMTGPGLELKTRRPRLERLEEEIGHGEGHEGAAGIAEDLEDRIPGEEENLFLWRFGVGYNFPISERVALVPIVSLDLVREEGHWVEALVFTVSLGYEF